MKFFKILFALLFAPKVSLVSHKCEVRMNPGFQVWEMEEKRDPVEVPYNKFMEFAFEKAFLIILKHFNLDMDIFYWLGANSSMEKRKHTAYYVGLLIIQLAEEVPHVRISSISREVDSIESKAFCQHFNLTHRYLQKLYRVSGSSGQHVMQIPCSYQELNFNDSFVLDFQNGIYVWNAFSSNKCKRKTAIALARSINRIEYDGKCTIDLFDCGPNQEENVIQRIQLRFLSRIPDALFLLPAHVSNQSNTELKHIRHESVILKEFSMASNKIIDTLIETRPLQLSMLEEEKAYILKVLYNRSTFVYLGKHADGKVIQKAMVKAETSFLDNSKYDFLFFEVAWKKVTIIYGNQKLPVHFLINFDEEIKKLRR